MRNVHKDKVPQEWIRKQTLVNAERYITQELKEYEEKILGAEDKILVLETQLYTELVQSLSEFIPAIQINANQIARLDCLLSFATAARENNYIRPVISDDEVLEIHQGRHPVIEKQLPIGEKYIANDVMLDSSTQQIIIITGPNMAGKSALLRPNRLDHAYGADRQFRSGGKRTHRSGGQDIYPRGCQRQHFRRRIYVYGGDERGGGHLEQSLLPQSGAL